ncbi:nitronate monooxygenase [Mesorhizobium sp. L-8-3]|uniref:nitronate monooxygenase n=1 Tax=Mesorhizobium sp. L-8-3 TaxID=2744522 RepID=UPI001928DB8B|nr:nitronate monooxygenase [Mesorhizobium sp. L-8-3]BCH25026.1 2-nitropropane dioxygenase [Mesorhizobium sp. L-8-3]
MTRAAVLTRRLGLSVPILLAPMAQVSGGALAAAVSRAGGFGFIGGGYCDPDWVAQELKAAADTPVGVGFITWALAERPALLDAVMRHRPRAVFLSFGDIAPFAERIRAAGIPLFAQIQTVAGAREAAAQGADVIVAQGGEAGGHGAARGTLALLPAVRDAIGDLPLVAAGGIADGRTMAAALVLGADAVLCGTAFYAAEESLAHPRAKATTLRTVGDETARSSVFDAARGIAWPAPWTLRARRNAFHERWRSDPTGIGPDERARYARAAAAGDTDTAAVIVGEAVDLVREALPAAAIIARIADNARHRLSAAPNLDWTAAERVEP